MRYLQLGITHYYISILLMTRIILDIFLLYQFGMPPINKWARKIEYGGYKDLIWKVKIG